MLTPSLTFAWALWRQHGRGLCIVSACLLAGALLSALLPPYCAPESVALAFVLLSLTALSGVTVFSLSIFFSGFESVDLMARESCFPARLFRLPVRTASLVRWPMLAGAAAVVFLWLFISQFLMQPWLDRLDEKAPLWWPALFLAASQAWIQALAWYPFGLRGLRVFLLFVLFAALAILSAFGIKAHVSEGWLVGAFASLTLAAWAVGYAGVRSGRRGDVPDWEAILKPLLRIARWWPRSRSPFASAARAQVWYEWRLSGLTLPIITGMILPLALVPLRFGKNDVLPPEQTLLSVLAIPVILAGLWGGRGGGNDGKGRLGSCSATLPLSTTEMVAAMLKVAALSSLATWALMAVALAVGVVATGNLDIITGWWRQAVSEHHPVQVITGIVALAMLLFVATWKRQVDRLYFGLTGQRWVAVSIAVIFFLSIFVCILVASLYRSPETRETFLAALPWLLGPLVLVRFLLSVWALRVGLRRSLLQPRTAVHWVTAWLLLASSLFVVLAWAVPGELVPRHYVAFAVLFAMPMARLAATPLALAWNRHR
jgi:hypothetical protein